MNKGSSLTKTKTVELETPKAKKSAKVAKAESKLATVAEALAKGGMKPSDVAKVLKALM